MKCPRTDITMQDADSMQLLQRCYGFLLVLVQVLPLLDSHTQTLGCNEGLIPSSKAADFEQGRRCSHLLAGQVSQRLCLSAAQQAPVDQIQVLKCSQLDM